MSDKFPIKLKVEAFSKGCKLHCELDMNPYDVTTQEYFTVKDSELRECIRKFMKMWEEETGDKFIKSKD